MVTVIVTLFRSAALPGAPTPSPGLYAQQQPVIQAPPPPLQMDQATLTQLAATLFTMMQKPGEKR